MKHFFLLIVGALMCSTLILTGCNQGDSYTKSEIEKIARNAVNDTNDDQLNSEDEDGGVADSDESSSGIPGSRTTKRPTTVEEYWEYKEDGLIADSMGPIQLNPKDAQAFLATLRNGWDYINQHPDMWVWRDGSAVGAPGKGLATLQDGRQYEFYLRLRGLDDKAYFWARSVSDGYIDQMLFQYDYTKQQNAGTIMYRHFTPKKVKKGERVRDTGEAIMDEEKAVARFTEMIKKVPLIASVPAGSTDKVKAIAFDKTPQEKLLAKLPGPTEKSEKKDTVSEKSGLVGSLERKKLDKIETSKKDSVDKKDSVTDKTPPSKKKK